MGAHARDGATAADAVAKQLRRPRQRNIARRWSGLQPILSKSISGFVGGSHQTVSDRVVFFAAKIFRCVFFISSDAVGVRTSGSTRAEMVGATAGGIATFNVQHGYVEALVRGFRSGFLDDVDYHHLTQCESLEGTMRGATGRRFFIFTWFQYTAVCWERMLIVVCVLMCVSLSRLLMSI